MRIQAPGLGPYRFLEDRRFGIGIEDLGSEPWMKASGPPLRQPCHVPQLCPKSFTHTADQERLVYEVKDKELTDVAAAYVRARTAVSLQGTPVKRFR